MDEKPLIVCAMVLLVLGSLSNVVGYQSVKSNVNDSPLFNVRTQRATNQQQNSITSQYIGKGNVWNIPMSDNRNEQLKKALVFISKMDDESFARFTELCIQKPRQNDTLRDVSRYQIVQSLLLLKTNPDAIINFYSNKNNQENPTTLPTYCGTQTLCGDWYPGCWIRFSISLFFALPFIIIIILISSILHYFSLQ